MEKFQHDLLPTGSMYSIFPYIYHRNKPNVGKYTIHGSYGPMGYSPLQGTQLYKQTWGDRLGTKNKNP